MDEVLRRFNEAKIRYLVIGGQAIRLEGMPRFSMDWDFYIPPKDEANTEAINRVLGDALDVPLLGLGPKGQNAIQTYQTPWGILQFHLGGPGLPPFEEAEKRVAIHSTEEGVRVACINGRDLLDSKRKVNRPQDQNDILFLEKKSDAGLL